MFRCSERQLVVVELGLTAASNCAFNVKSDGLITP
jgi:hypothetical protein